MIQFVDVKIEKDKDPIRMAVTWEKDEEAEPSARYIAAVSELSVVVVGPSIRLTENRLEMKIREQIAIMKAHGMFREWLRRKRVGKGTPDKSGGSS